MRVALLTTVAAVCVFASQPPTSLEAEEGKDAYVEARKGVDLRLEERIQKEDMASSGVARTVDGNDTKPIEKQKTGHEGH